MKFKQLTCLFFLFCSTGVFAQTHSTEIGAETDNDSYLLQGSDRYYTDGIFIYYRHALKVNESSKLANKVLGFEFGQKIFNPQSGSIANAQGVDLPNLIDRPFAAYMYIGASLNLLYKDESSLKLTARVGIIGPGAEGKQIQDFVHDNFGFYHPSGWEYQINNEAQINLSAEYNKLLVRGSWIDVSLSGYLNLGNGFTGAGAGPLVRLGSFNQLFNSVSTQSTAIRKEVKNPLNKHEIFFYYKPLANYVAYDATIQGGLFDNHSGLEITKNKEPFIFSQQFGVAFSTNRFVFDIAAIFHTLDDREMVQSHQWAAITGLYRFR
ncbi:lipid A deacylase LpxR family protein [Mucilaginibacter sp.]|uniref:lipid A deacylase LpxR family protein n=1 Tax=Mucilaginibacter sp. TaxID=1882438 RepID=UPI00284D5857|nr:lipid A deacylase LpxR family protein [Mucilaginibacter sp.]MDR3693304.1 lipid A deacylase LpxR family protein [Mucilaginibacter sp.]